MVVMMRVDYRYLRLASVPFYVVALVLLVLVFVPALNIVVGGSARWLKLGPLPAIHPAEIAKLALVIYLAHWFAKRGRGVHGFWAGTVPFLVIIAPVIALVFQEPDLGTTTVIALTAFTMFFVAGANLFHLGAIGGRGRAGGRWSWSCAATSWTGSGPGSTRGPTRSGTASTRSRGCWRSALGGILGTGLGESRLAGGLFLPNAFNDFIFAIIGEEFGLIGGALVIALFLLLAYSGIRVALAAPDTFGALLAAGITAWLCIQAFINIGVVVALIPITGITLPFISAGGSSLIISFAAVGILLSISRETVEKGTWNDDATADRGRRARADTSTRPSPSPARSALDRTPPELGWLGGHRGLEAGLVPRRRHPAAPARRCARCGRSTRDVHAVLDPLRLAASVPQAAAILARERPAAIFTTGGYVAVPVAAGRRPAADPGRAVGRQRHPRPRGPRDRPPRRRASRSSFEATCRGPGAARRRAVLRDRDADPRRRRRSTARPPARGSDLARAPGSC